MVEYSIISLVKLWGRQGGGKSSLPEGGRRSLMKRAFFLAALVASATANAAVLDEDVVLYYDFETIGADPNKVANIANPGTMDLEGYGNWENASYPVEATPAATLRQARLAATSEDSAKALRTTWSSGNTVACRYFQPTENWFSTTNFTVEFFYKMDGSIPTWTPLFRREGASNVQINIGVGGTASQLTATVMTGEDPYTTVSIDDDAATGDGKWHHAALVVSQTGATKTVRFYRDYKLKGSQTLANNLSAKNANPYVILSGKGDGNCFNGWMDSVRVTLRALEPQEFLWGEGMEIGRFPAGTTLAHVKFDDGTVNADVEGGTMTNGVAAISKDGGNLPSFSDDVPGARIIDGVDGAVLAKNNTKSLSFASSKVTWSDSYDTYYLRNTLTGDTRTAFTVEFFFKPNGTQNNWSRLVSGLAGDNFSSGYAYALTFSDLDSGKSLSLRGDGNSYGYLNLDCRTDVCDGKWHHAAITVAPNTDDSTKSDVTFHLDYGTENGGWTGTETSTKALVTHPSNLYFVLGTGGSGIGYNGLIDELRISAGALTPSQFLRAEKAPGLTIVFR